MFFTYLGLMVVLFYIAYLITSNFNKFNNLFFRIGQIHTSDSSGVEFMSSLMLLSWSTVLFMPGSTFATSSSYHAMAVLASETAWAAIAGLIGVAQLFALLHGRRRGRQWGCLAGTAFWAFVATLVGVANSRSTGGAVYTVVTLANIWAYGRNVDNKCYLRRKTDRKQEG